MTASVSKTLSPLSFEAPYDWLAIDHAIHTAGSAILVNLFPPSEVATLNTEIDNYLAAQPGSGKPQSSSEAYDRFLGHNTVRLQGLIEKLPSAAAWIGSQTLCEWAARALEPVATSTLLNAGELIQIGPDEPRQYLHRDTDSWPLAPTGEHPVIVNAIVALSPFSFDNGATHLVPGSHCWQHERRAKPQEMAQAVMEPGDGLLFRGDVLHGGGANSTSSPRRAVSLSYCAGWLRPVENSILNISRGTVRSLPAHLRGLLGYAAYDGTRDNGGLVGLYENGDPGVLVRD